MSIIKSGIIVGLFTFLSRIFGFVRDIFISNALGASIESDIFNIAFRLPNFFRRIFAEGAFNAAFIPIFNTKINNSDDTKNFLNQTFTILFAVLLILIIIIEISLPLFMYVLAPGFETNSGEWQMAINACRISMPYLLLISLASMLGSVLNSYGKYSFAAANPILLNLVMILSLVYLSGSAIYTLSIGITLAGIIQLLVMIYAVRKINLMPKFAMPKLSQDIRKLFKNMIPGIIGGGVMQINILVDQAIASFLAVGAISFLAYADRINQLPLALIGTAIGTVLLPSLSKQLNNKDYKGAISTQNRAIEIAIFFSIPASIALFMLSNEIVHLLFERGAFSEANRIDTAYSLSAFTLGLPAYVIVKVLTPIFFANFDTKTPLKISIICLLSNIVFNIILIPFLNYLAIPIATSISAWINISLIYRNLKKRDLIKIDTELIRNVKRIIFSCLVMIIVLLTCKYLLSENLLKTSNLMKIFCLSFIIISGFSSFMITSYYLKILNITELKGLFKKR